MRDDYYIDRYGYYRYENSRELVHRHIAKKYVVGRELRNDEVVHHINGNKLDNRPENLAVMTQEGHQAIHDAQDGFYDYDYGGTDEGSTVWNYDYGGTDEGSAIWKIIKVIALILILIVGFFVIVIFIAGLIVIGGIIAFVLILWILLSDN